MLSLKQGIQSELLSSICLLQTLIKSAHILPLHLFNEKQIQPLPDYSWNFFLDEVFWSTALFSLSGHKKLLTINMNWVTNDLFLHQTCKHIWYIKQKIPRHIPRRAHSGRIWLTIWQCRSWLTIQNVTFKANCNRAVTLRRLMKQPTGLE